MHIITPRVIMGVISGSSMPRQLYANWLCSAEHSLLLLGELSCVRPLIWHLWTHTCTHRDLWSHTQTLMHTETQKCTLKGSLIIFLERKRSKQTHITFLSNICFMLLFLSTYLSSNVALQCFVSAYSCYKYILNLLHLHAL